MNKKRETKKITNEEVVDIFKTRFNEKFEELGVSQKSFALDTKISQGAITKYKNGEMLPNMEVLERIAKKLNVSVNYLLGKSDVPTFDCDDINKKTGLSQNAIGTLYRLQHEYFELEENFKVNIEEQRKISKTYKEELHILSQIIEDNIKLIDLLYNIKKYKSQKEELQALIKLYKETKDHKIYLTIIDIKKEIKFFKFNAMETFSNIIEDISKEETKN